MVIPKSQIGSLNNWVHRNKYIRLYIQSHIFIKQNTSINRRPNKENYNKTGIETKHKQETDTDTKIEAKYRTKITTKTVKQKKKTEKTKNKETCNEMQTKRQHVKEKGRKLLKCHSRHIIT